jgi:hypothetical protein
MKKLFILILILGVAGLSGKAFGQQAKEKETEKRGGFAVGGYDNTRQESDKSVTKRSVQLPADEIPAEKAAEAEKVPAAEAKESGQTRSEGAKNKQKPKKAKAKGNRR